MTTTTDPGVPVHCIFSHNLPTDRYVTLTTGAGEKRNEVKNRQIELSDGDGTVSVEGSLDVCTRWDSTVKTYKVPGIVHRYLMEVEQAADVIVAVATDNKDAWSAWTAPKPSNIRFMSGNGDIEVKDVTDSLYNVEA